MENVAATYGLNKFKCNLSLSVRNGVAEDIENKHFQVGSTSRPHNRVKKDEMFCTMMSCRFILHAVRLNIA